MKPIYCSECGKMEEIKQEPSSGSWDRTNIRTSLTYCLPAGIKDFEWEVIINTVESLIKQAEEKAKAETIEEVIRILPDIVDDEIVDGIGNKYIALQDLITSLTSQGE